MTVQFFSPHNHPSTPLFDRPEISSFRALTRFISTRTSPLTTKPYSAPRQAVWAAYAQATSVFVGMQPVFTHVPPNLWRSIMATVIPASVHRAANDGPAWPVPMMIASKCRDTGDSVKKKMQATSWTPHLCSSRRRRRLISGSERGTALNSDVGKRIDPAPSK